MKLRLFNPFVYLAGGRSLLIGLGAIMVTAVIACLSEVHFDGVLDVHKRLASVHAQPYVYIIEPLISWLIATLVFYGAGLLFSKSSVRLVDVAGTMAVARWPLFFVAIIGFFYHVDTLVVDPNDLGKMMGAIIGGLTGLPFIIWMVVLMYNAFTVSCNLKGGKAAGVFAGALTVAEVVSIVVFHYVRF